MDGIIGKAIVFTLLLSSASALAYPTPVDFSGKLSRWNITKDSLPIAVRVVVNVDDKQDLYQALVADAAHKWSEVSTSYLRLALVAPEDHANITINIESSINGSQFSSGYAVFDERDKGGPLHCSIFVKDSGSIHGLSKTVLHEIGHCLGLGHSLIPQAIMSYNSSENRYALDTDDRAALTRLYPADGSTPQLPPGCAIFSHDGKPSRNIALWLLLILPGVAAYLGSDASNVKAIRKKG